MGAREENRERREQTLIDAAISAIAELGLSSVRVSDIAERAGMTTGHVSYYFPQKSELLRRAIETSERTLVDDAQAAMLELSDPVKKLDVLIDLSLADRQSDPGWLLWFQVWAEAALDPSIAESHHLLDGRWRELLRQVVAEGTAAGIFASDDVDADTAAIAAMLDGLSIQLTVGAPGYSADQIRRVATSAARTLLGMRA
ncbi:TetR/AcrR family transcriptional regulator [Brevibacterium casei]|uniref:TetR/AcrR family transcriptional regulator n=1 Tax=Brevibacterium casei TaxID=33889 RepID=UPI0036FE40BD